MAWRWASASVIGTSHIKNHNRLQDAYAVRELGDGCIFAVVSDGAGSAKFGAFGAWLTCRFLSVRCREWVQKNPKLPNDDVIWRWIDELRDQISAIATQRGTTSRQFAATVATIVVNKDEIIILHVGDSAIAGRKNEKWEALCWPENGEYASSTYFITDAPEPRLNIIRPAYGYNAFALFSDGIGDLANCTDDFIKLVSLPGI